MRFVRATSVLARARRRVRRFSSAALCGACTVSPLAAAPIYGVTIDTTRHISTTAAALSALPYRPTTRVYFEVHEPAAYYRGALEALAPATSIMGELLDSSDERKVTVAAYQRRVLEYLGSLGSLVSIWEIGNEVNGSWTGSPQQVEERLVEAYDDVSTAGGVSALTLYANNFGPDNCGDGAGELTPLQFGEQRIPAGVASGLDYVLLSYYPTQCGGREPSSQEVGEYLQRLHRIFPNALLGFGEVGLPRPARGERTAAARQIMEWAYSLNPQLPYYAGGYFWWYGYEDALSSGAPLSSSLVGAFESEHQALAG